MAKDKLFEFSSNEVGQEPFIPLGGEFFDFDSEFFDFEAACNDGTQAPGDTFEDMSTTFFKDACFFDEDLEKYFNSNQGSGNSFEFDQTFTGLASDNSLDCFGDDNLFAGLRNNDTFDFVGENNYGKLSNDTFLCPSKETSMAVPRATAEPVKNTLSVPSKPAKILTKDAKVTKAPRKPKKAPVAKKAPAPKKAPTPKRERPAIAPRERTLEELSNCAWGDLTLKERERLLLPWIQGTDPITGAKVTSSNTTSTECNFQTSGLNPRTERFETSTSTQNPPAKSFSSPYEALTTGIHTLSNDQIMEQLIQFGLSKGYDVQGNKIGTTPVLSSGSNIFNTGRNVNMTNTSFGTQTANSAAVGIKNNTNFSTHTANNAAVGTKNDTNFGFQAANTFAFGTNYSPVLQGYGYANINTTTPGQGYTYTYGNNSYNNKVMSQVVRMPAPPAVYGSTRQYEALQRNALLQAQGRRR